MPFSLAILQAIKSEINTDPVSRGYAGKTDYQISVLMNEKLSQSPQVFLDLTVGIQDAVLVLIKRGKWRGVLTAAAAASDAGGPNDSAFGIVEAAKLTAIQDNTLATGAFRNAVDTLVTAGVLNAADRTAILNIARQEVLRSRAEIIIGVNMSVRTDDITQAKAS